MCRGKLIKNNCFNSWFSYLLQSQKHYCVFGGSNVYHGKKILLIMNSDSKKIWKITESETVKNFFYQKEGMEMLINMWHNNPKIKQNAKACSESLHISSYYPVTTKCTVLTWFKSMHVLYGLFIWTLRYSNISFS